MSTPIKNGVSYYHRKDGCIYLIGGWDEKETLDTIFKYDPRTQETHFVAHLPHKIEGHSLCAIDSTLFIFGGFDSFGVTDTIIAVDTTNWESQVLKDIKMKYKRENLTSQVINGDTIVVAGGWGSGKSMDYIEVFKVEGKELRAIPEEEHGLSLSCIRNRPCSVSII